MKEINGLEELLEIRDQEVQTAMIALAQKSAFVRDAEHQLATLIQYTQEYRQFFGIGTHSRPDTYADLQLFMQRLSKNIGMLEDRLQSLKRMEAEALSQVTLVQQKAEALRRALEAHGEQVTLSQAKRLQEQCDESIRMTMAQPGINEPYR
ncbi:MAG: hypothetical protein KTR35_23720 [Gammaproteobacteria bacterium]|nr:hypothetical protein [Gammaproteobacteria bacterium]